MWRDEVGAQRIVDHAEATFRYVIPVTPMVLALPCMLLAGRFGIRL